MISRAAMPDCAMFIKEMIGFIDRRRISDMCITGIFNFTLEVLPWVSAIYWAL